MKNSINNALKPDLAASLWHVIEENLPSPEVEYIENGYDSCQSHRKLAKVAGEAILLGGLMYEANLLGKNLSISEVKSLVNSNLSVGDEEGIALKQIAKDYGAKQDFLFPGVTASSDALSLEKMMISALLGDPETSVRCLTGVGGIRSDRDWNYVTDLVTFAKLKVSEDKRYYPGIGIFYLLLGSEIPIKGFENLWDWAKETKKTEYVGVSMLCSQFLVNWSELRDYQSIASDQVLELSEAFHSPSYEFFPLLHSDSMHSDMLVKKLSYLWSFNSTIHLPWTAELAGLSNNLIGKITNAVGDCGIRYGVGYKGKSLEVRELFYGSQRKYPHGLAGKRAYVIRIYQTDDFKGSYKEDVLTYNHSFCKSINEQGFLKTALEELKHV